ncbi:MAG TPA: hypothetical protein PLU18_08090 [Ferruginibacter sp.]|nr:hypothetical protein [Ferruginibacter sp.]
MTKQIFVLVIFTAYLFAIMSCKGNNNHTKHASSDSSLAINKPAINVQKKENETLKAPIINIIDSFTSKAIYIMVKDSAANEELLAKKFNKIFDSILTKVIKTNKLSLKGSPACWYQKNKAPYFFEAGLPVDKIPAKLPKKVFTKQTQSDSALVAHFFGPYNLTAQGYTALKDMLKEIKPGKKAGTAFEVYVDDPMDEKGKLKNPYKVQTNIILPYH